MPILRRPARCPLTVCSTQYIHCLHRCCRLTQESSSESIKGADEPSRTISPSRRREVYSDEILLRCDLRPRLFVIIRRSLQMFICRSPARLRRAAVTCIIRSTSVAPCFTQSHKRRNLFAGLYTIDSAASSDSERTDARLESTWFVLETVSRIFYADRPRSVISPPID